MSANPYQEAFDLINAKLDRLIAQTGPKRPSEDEKIHKDPKNSEKTTYWTGKSYAGCQMSECPADYLRAMAKYKNACIWAANKKFKETGDSKELDYVDKNKATAAFAISWAEYRDAVGGAVTLTKANPVSRQADAFAPPGDDSEIF